MAFEPATKPRQNRHFTRPTPGVLIRITPTDIRQPMVTFRIGANAINAMRWVAGDRVVLLHDPEAKQVAIVRRNEGQTYTLQEIGPSQMKIGLSQSVCTDAMLEQLQPFCECLPDRDWTAHADRLIVYLDRALA